MLKNISQLEAIVEGKTCRFQCDIDTPISFVKEALFQFQKYIGQVEDNARAKQEAEKKEASDICEDCAQEEVVQT